MSLAGWIVSGIAAVVVVAMLIFRFTTVDNGGG